MDCSKWFSCRSGLNRHNKKIHTLDIQTNVDNNLRLSGEMYGVGTSQSKFENADNKVDVNSQTDFDDDDRSKVVNDSYGSDSDDRNQHSDFSLRCCYCSYSK